MKLINIRNSGLVIIFLTLIAVIGLLPIDFLISALVFAIVVRGGLYLIDLAIASDPNSR